MQAAFKAIEFMHSGTAAGAVKPVKTVHSFEVSLPIGSAPATLMMSSGTRHERLPTHRTNTRLQPFSVCTERVRSEEFAQERRQHRR